MRHHRPDKELAAAGDRPVLGGADRQDRRLRRVEDRHELLDPEHAEVRDRERPVVEIALLEPAVARPAYDLGPGGRELRQRQALGRADDRHDEPLRRGHRDADVRRREDLQRVLRELDVDPAVAHQGHRRHLREQVGDRNVHVRVELSRARDELVRARHLRRDGQLEHGRLPRGGQPARDRLADARQRDGLDLARHGHRGGRGGRRGLRRRGCALDVFRDDPALRAGALHTGQLDAALARDPPRERRGLDPPARKLLGGRGRAVAGVRLLDTHLAAVLPLGLARRAARALLARVRPRGDRDLADCHLLAFLADPGDRLPDGHLALGDGDLQQHARGLGLHLLRHLVGVELVQRIALLDGLALGLQPLDDRPGLHPLAEARQFDLVRH